MGGGGMVSPLFAKFCPFFVMVFNCEFPNGYGRIND